MADLVADLRASSALPPLKTHVISVISHLADETLDGASAERMKEAKMSSTFIREWIAGGKSEI